MAAVNRWLSARRRVDWVVLAAARTLVATQLAILLGLSTRLWQRGELTWDFSIFNQAAWLIAHGHLNPYDTVRGMPFVANNAELIMWPLSFLTRLPGGGWWLLAVQDLAIAATGWLVIGWAAEASRSARWRSPLPVWAAVAVAAVLVVGDPLAWRSAAYDFHIEVIGAFFALATARAAWRGHRRMMWLSGLMTLACGNVAALYIIATVCAGLVARGAARPSVTRRSLWWLGVAAGSWMAFLTLTGGNQGSTLAANYGYIAVTGPGAAFGIAPSGRPVTTWQIVLGALRQPGRWLAHLYRNLHYLVSYVRYGGVIGVFTAWGASAALFVLLPSMLAHGSGFASVGFQNEPGMAFVVMGTVFGIAWAFARLRSLSNRERTAVALVLVGAFLVTPYTTVPGYAQPYEGLNRPTIATLAAVRAEIPTGTEVVVSQSVAGRFSARPWEYAVIRSPQLVPVRTATIDFVLLDPSPESITGDDTEAMVEQIVAQGATIVHRADAADWVWFLKWTPPPGTDEIVLRGPKVENMVTDPNVFRPAGSPPCASLACGSDPAYRPPAVAALSMPSGS